MIRGVTRATTVVTNLRLPGQYDERLLSSLGLQGPYYNWNRWYLPSVGRYLELDPVALWGEFNGEYGPDWYNYGSGNPLSNVDPRGLFDNSSCPGCYDTCCCAAMKYGPDACPGAPPPKPRPLPLPPPSPCSKLITCKFLSAGGKGPAPGEKMRCTYTCEDGGRSWQETRYYTECPDEITVRSP